MPQTLHENLSIGEVLHFWKFREYDNHDRSVRWYAIMTILFIALLAYGVFTDNFLFSVIIILFSVILFLQSNQKAPEIQCAVTDEGLILGDKFYGYPEFDEFFIIHDDAQDLSVLFIDTKNSIRPQLVLPISEHDPIEIRSSLREFLPENLEQDEEPLLHFIGRTWKI